MIPASLLTCDSPVPIGIVTKSNPLFWRLFTRSTFNRSALVFCSTVRTALNAAADGFAPGNSVSSILSFHVPEKSGFDCGEDARAMTRQRSAIFGIMGPHCSGDGTLDGIAAESVYDEVAS